MDRFKARRAPNCLQVFYGQSDQVRTSRTWPGEQSKKGAAARRATRRLPLGEPPLVLSTHSITSFTISLLGSAGVQPRAEASFSPSYHARTTRKSTRLCDPGRHLHYINESVGINSFNPGFLDFAPRSPARPRPLPPGFQARRAVDGSARPIVRAAVRPRRGGRRRTGNTRARQPGAR